MKRKIKKKYVHSIFSLCVVSMLIVLISGCLLGRAIKHQDARLIRKVLITSFENQTFYTHCDINTKFQQTFLNAAKDILPDILLVTPNKAEFPASFSPLPKMANNINNSALAETGRQIGVNAIITGVLKSITSNKREKGMWWFKEDRNFAQIQLNVAVYDTQTATKLVDVVLEREIEVEESASEAISLEKNEELPTVNNTLLEMLHEISEEISETINAWPWKGYVKSVTGNTIIISAGEKAGLLPGDIFDIFGNTVIFKGQENHSFSGYGSKTGEVQIAKVSPDSAEAFLVSGEIPDTGMYIKLKPGVHSSVWQLFN